MDYEQIMKVLLDETAASRTTLRFDRPPMNYPVAAEACAPGVPSIRHDNSIDQRNGATVQWTLATGRVLVVEDALTSDPAPPQAIIDVYGLRAFLLAPLKKTAPDNLLGWISVHYNDGPRQWTQQDVAAIERAVARVHDTHARSGDPG